MTVPGYFRQPTLRTDQIVFVNEDELWSAPVVGGLPRRLSAGPGTASFPALSPDGHQIAFISSDEGPGEVAVMPAEGGPARRLTWLGATTYVVGWTPWGEILFASNHAQPFRHLMHLYTVSPTGGQPQPVPVGPAVHGSFAPPETAFRAAIHGSKRPLRTSCAGGSFAPRTGQSSGLGRGMVIGRHTLDGARWKRYRGGRAGDLWIDRAGKGTFNRLIELDGNLTQPLWLGDRIYFVSDHEGTGNLYSCLTTGQDLRRHTDHEEYYVRFPATDGERIVYQAGADLYLFDPHYDATRKIEIRGTGSRPQTVRKFVDTARYTSEVDLHPDGHMVAFVSRGKLFTMGNWEGPARQHGERDGVRYRVPRWINGGKGLACVSDADGEPRIELHAVNDQESSSTRFPKIDVGYVRDLKVSPRPESNEILLTNHRNELIHLDLGHKTPKPRILGRSPHGEVAGFDWSPDGRWAAFGCAVTRHTTVIQLCRIETGEIFPVTRPVLQDVSPTFDPTGKYLYFLSHREFDPVYDNLHFELGFPKGVRPYMVVLAKTTPTPFQPVAKPVEATDAAKKANPGDIQAESARPGKTKRDAKAPAGKTGATPPAETKIDADGLPDRVLAIPVPDGRYQQIAAISGKVLFTSVPIEGALNQNWMSGDPAAKATLHCYDTENLKHDQWITGITNFSTNITRKMMILRSGCRIRVAKSGEKPDENAAKEGPGKKSGWIDLSRARVSVKPQAEWRQMCREAWMLMKHFFWRPDLARIDWDGVWKRYSPLLERVSTRGEFSDLMWEMQGEVGASHCYEMGGDYRSDPQYALGFLGADLACDASRGLWRIAAIPHGDPWDEARSSPLGRPGLNIEPGQTLLAIDRVPVSSVTHPGELLVHRAGTEIDLTVGDAKGRNPRTVTAKLLANETPLRYRAWVERNRAIVHEATKGRVGYVHVPDMGPLGYSEFHRGFLAEVDREGLIVDVRFNGGGHVSQLILEKLARRRIAYIQSRWFGIDTYPTDAVAGPIVAVTNEYAGSDGDIFSHCFKMLKLGPLLGKRTWGGVIGIWPRQNLVDGCITTQPEFSFWFSDVGWGVENYGTDPDIEIEFAPQDAAAGRDPQLQRAIAEALKGLPKHALYPPKLTPAPHLTAPRLPHRTPGKRRR